MPDLTIITVHLNDFDGLSRTQRSLAAIHAPGQAEWIVVDGDSTLESENEPLFMDVKSRATHFISEPDEGIYDAMNKGTRIAGGEYVLYLNAGDELHPCFDLDKFKRLVSRTRPDMVLGRCEVQYQDEVKILVKTRSPSLAWYSLPANHQATFFRREVLGEAPYDTHYRLAADYDLVCRLLKGGASVDRLDSIVSVFYRGGSTDVRGDLSRKEENEIRMNYFGISPVIGNAIVRFKTMNARQSRISQVLRFWRRWI